MSGALIFKLFILSFAIVNSLVLVIKGNKGQIRNYFLGWSLGCYSLYFLVFILWYEMGFILDYPHLMRTGSPIGFLAAPFFYFFVRNNVFGYSGFQKWDWIHFLPALLHVLDLMPFYLQPESVKLEMAQQILSKPYQLDVVANGLIHPNVVNGFRLSLMLGYFIWSCLILTRSDSMKVGFLKESWGRNWLMLAMVLIGGINFAYFVFRVAFFIGFANEVDLADIQAYASYMILVCTAILSLYIHSNPESVFEIEEDKSGGEVQREPISKSVLAENSSPKIENALHPETSQEMLDEKVRDRIISLFEDREIFKEKGLLVGDFAKQLGISVRELPLYFRHYFDSDFKSMVNDYRVCLARKKIEEGYLDDFTLEALGEHCGFSSRTTFFNAFKKKYGKSPSDYWKAFQESGS
jgi:AraC-like DNA-binding protein